MFANFQYRHLPALFTAAAQCWVADVPETWTVWHVGNARTACLGILMFTFYAQRRYDVLDTFLIVNGGYLGLADFYILWNEGLPSTGVFRLLSSSVFAVLGLIGFTQGPKS
ncbi:hypothetical protein J7T55_001584 [Diaporthe amygdali]|uniref:uncharacterized protein n=1 Tax=Phomopsis amygdali TaxID=1214568 RepID=UPI0022FEAAB9|nr:uncharacterized protein J7T55_001584 [Diaporthe amygdali]KAJ0115174.1 hypothetical protein J7T55_001584 [Diaporthe amygdali]